MTTKVRKSKLEEGKIIPISLDYVFTRIFNDKSNIEIVESFIGCILDIQLYEVQGKLEVISRELPIESKQESDAKVDLLLHYGDEKNQY